MLQNDFNHLLPENVFVILACYKYIIYKVEIYEKTSIRK